MIKTILIATLLSLMATSVQAEDGIYFRIGAGYKLSEASRTVNGKTTDYAGDTTARIGLWAEYGDVTFGIDHHSQYDVGWPVDNRKEYFKTEIFIDVKFKLMGF